MLREGFRSHISHGYPTGRQAAANAYPQVKDMMKTDIRDVDGNYELDILLHLRLYI